MQYAKDVIKKNGKGGKTTMDKYDFWLDLVFLICMTILILVPMILLIIFY